MSRLTSGMRCCAALCGLAVAYAYSSPIGAVHGGVMGAYSSPRGLVRGARASRLASAQMLAGSITITGNNIELTESLRNYVDEKIGAVVSKHGHGDVTRCDAHLSVIQNPRVPLTDTFEVVIFSKGTVVRAAERSESMYSSIDLVASKIGRKLQQLKSRRQDKSGRTSTATTAGAFEAEVAEAAVEPTPSATSIVRRKQFPMPKQSLEDAMMCLEYLGHDFYVYRNEAGEVNVLYKRNEGGLGLIEPEKK
ncbi:ribosomal protein S30Ae/sigma 54 modulation protein [Pavlovales sp. CCMP2436]|nr:ribosomal protein S30Ae/sigma 54 modulation protein [Pavlovales sp. CCMP2436]|mmetsp:Transcript_44680/g.110786  ORF Transcript_44680/g.110786 Transcript_44680/m.110786 type:complete len:250 (-) Transcript_44680:255-1004(-)